MAKKYYLLGVATADNICVQKGLVKEGASADEALQALHQARSDGRRMLIDLGKKWGADTYFSDASGSFHGYKFCESLDEDVAAIFRKPDRHGTRTLRSKAPKKELKDLHAKYLSEFKAAHQKHSDHWTQKEHIDMFNALGLSQFDFVINGGGLVRGKADTTSWCLKSEVPPKTMTYTELTVSEFESL